MRGVVRFDAVGLPRPQGSKRAFVHNGKARLVESGGALHKDWRATVSAAAADAMRGLQTLEGPVALSLTFHLPRPKSHPKTKRTWPTARPDVDKLVRAVADSCTHLIWKDDSQVVTLTARKQWAFVDSPNAPGVSVAVYALDLVHPSTAPRSIP